MKRICKRAEGGGYTIKGKHYDKCVGSRAEVGHGTAYKTSGGLTKSDIKQNKHGRWVSKALSTLATKEKRLKRAGYHTKKGKFGSYKVNTAKGKKSRRSHKKTKRRRRHRSRRH